MTKRCWLTLYDIHAFNCKLSRKFPLFENALLTLYTYDWGCGSTLLRLQMSNNPVLYFYTYLKCAVYLTLFQRMLKAVSCRRGLQSLQALHTSAPATTQLTPPTLIQVENQSSEVFWLAPVFRALAFLTESKVMAILPSKLTSSRTKLNGHWLGWMTWSTGEGRREDYD